MLCGMRHTIRDIGRFFRFLGSMLKEAFDAAWANNIGRMAASIAYFGAFSLAPIIVIMITLASLVFGKDATQGLISERLASTFGEETANFVQSMIAAIYGSTGLTLATVLAILVLIWASTRIVGSVRGALNDIWGVKGHGGGGWLGFFVGKLIDVAMVIAIGFMFLLSMLVSAAVTGMIKYFSQHLPMPGWLLQVLSIVFSLTVTIGFIAVIFRVLPNIRVRFLHILVGASITGILFTVGNYVIGLYLGRTSPGSAFGAAGSLAVIMIWIYYVAYLIIYGAEVTRAYTHRITLRQVREAASEAAESEEATTPAESAQPDEAAQPEAAPAEAARPEPAQAEEAAQPAKASEAAGPKDQARPAELQPPSAGSA
jgi:membrane protein